MYGFSKTIKSTTLALALGSLLLTAGADAADPAPGARKTSFAPPEAVNNRPSLEGIARGRPAGADNMLVFNPPTLKRLVDKVGATNVGAEMDPSHLFWQGIDPVAAIEWLGPLVFHAAAKDTRINKNCEIYGVLDERFTRIPASQNPTGLGGKHVVNKWPEDSAWDFVAVGRGHDVDFWTRFLQALEKVDPDMWVNIEHEDVEFDALDGLRVAAESLTSANSAPVR